MTEDAYSDVATVHLHQSGVRDGVEVVQTETQHLWFDGARWRWFFGFDMEYLDGFMRQVPSDATPSAQFAELDHARLNMVWSEIFDIAGAPYDAPDGVNVFNIMDLPLQTGCGWLTAEDYAEAFYCDLDQELYFESGFRDTIERDYGPDAWTVALAWVWANHLQFELGIDASEQPELDGGMYPIEVYLQADCLTGVYVQEAIARGWLVPASTDTMQLLYDLIGDLSETPFDAADAHGAGEQRWQAFTAGLEDGLLGCDLDLTAAG